jgi:hypothetical protein
MENDEWEILGKFARSSYSMPKRDLPFASFHFPFKRQRDPAMQNAKW